MNYQIKAHAVQAQRIEKLEPLCVGVDRVLAPDAGILLRLESGARHKYLAEPNVPLPQSGDFLVVDSITRSSYVLSPSQFADFIIVND